MTQGNILTVTLNPALDIATSAMRVVPAVKLRCTAPFEDPGGGGINVSRAIAEMGGKTRAVVALGGAVGERIAALLKQPGLELITMAAPGDTRQSLAVSDLSSAQQFRFVMPGPTWSADFVQAALDLVASHAQTGFVVLSGSYPPGVPDDFAALLSTRLNDTKSLLIVDTSGDALRAVANHRGNLAVLRMDAAEAEDLAGRPLPLRSDTAAFAADLVRSRVASTVIVARGADGNILADRSGVWHADAAKVEVVSTVGAGDSFVAGYALGRARSLSTPDALGLGAAMASAACMTPATELCRRADVERLYDARVVTPL